MKFILFVILSLSSLQALSQRGYIKSPMNDTIYHEATSITKIEPTIKLSSVKNIIKTNPDTIYCPLCGRMMDLHHVNNLRDWGCLDELYNGKYVATPLGIAWLKSDFPAEYKRLYGNKK